MACVSREELDPCHSKLTLELGIKTRLSAFLGAADQGENLGLIPHFVQGGGPSDKDVVAWNISDLLSAIIRDLGAFVAFTHDRRMTKGNTGRSRHFNTACFGCFLCANVVFLAAS